jgi:acyl transferase domain-containing protein
VRTDVSHDAPNPSTSTVKQALLALETMKTRLEAAERANRAPIAVVGLACRFPGGAGSAAQLWPLLQGGVDAVRRIPPERWDADAYYDPDPAVPGRTHAPYGAFVDDIDLFDAPFFRISPIEAANMDPQQRLLMEVSWEALEHAGIAADALRGTRTGVFVGVCSGDYGMHTLGSRIPERLGAFSGTGVAASVGAGRLSYFYGFHGPSFPVDTACSSSLLSVHLACQSLRQSECDVALAAGVNLILSPDVHVYFSKTSALSPRGRCRAFDASGDGYVRAEGCGVVVLKALSRAIQDGDRVLAVVRGSSVNHDGRTTGLTAPNGQAQQAVIRAALANAGVAPAEVGYIEAHGTGTPLGDPIELRSLAAVFGDRPADRPLRIGSIKTNLGHLEGAAGIAGFIKTVLMLQHRQIPPHLHLEHPTPHFPWSESPIRVATALEPWEATGPRIAGISSFGFSGTNVHAIVEEGPAVAPSLRQRDRGEYLLPLSAASETALRALAGRYAEEFGTAPEQPLGDVCHTAAVGRARLPWRLAVVARDRDGLAAALGGFRDGATADGVYFGRQQARAPLPIVFQFTGQGAQYPGMGRRLFDQEPVFRAALEVCDELASPHLPRPLLSVLYPLADADAALIHETRFAQPALFAFEYALSRLWRSWGIEPDALTGHSIGEYVAATEAGVLSLEDAIRLVTARGRLMHGAPGSGAMLAVFATEAEVEAAVGGGTGVEIAAINGPEHVVISGAREAVEQFADRVGDAGILSRRLRVSHAFHSPLMEPILDELRAVAAGVPFVPPRIPLISNVTGSFFEGDSAPDGDYWARHVRRPVRYFPGLQTLVQAGYRLFIEVGPRPVLSELGRRALDGVAEWVWSCDEEEPEAHIHALARCHALGLAVDWEGVYPRAEHRRVVLPSYPFERRRYWIDAPGEVAAPTPGAAPPAGRDDLLNAFVDVVDG